MKSLQQIQYLIDEYQRLYRNLNLAPFVRGEIYSLYNRDRSSVVEAKLFWPETWPLCDRYGIYAIFADELLLYIGKASLQPLGNRLGSYFRYSEDRQSGIPKNGHVWTRMPTHVVTWAVPTESFFEASALEEYLIFNLGELLVDNELGKHT
ncbi:GIY-YIG nuclease family protein [Vibrio porteresiae]|uniref:GIY-YIG domain-containing protein n=1 Tax=Vibrio porteresiae DSM 19223 TaxID=1123496 RepID=A0ABZ0Q9G4_9VIBR|nr:hypothetical protein [Vibrio porteresiae]WPC73045.1 hypothetical protein R8Z52_13070 [Vibrio porteresiae DSM 19223]